MRQVGRHLACMHSNKAAVLALKKVSRLVR